MCVCVCVCAFWEKEKECFCLDEKQEVVAKKEQQQQQKEVGTRIDDETFYVKIQIHTYNKVFNTYFSNNECTTVNDIELISSASPTSANLSCPNPMVYFPDGTPEWSSNSF